MSLASLSPRDQKVSYVGFETCERKSRFFVETTSDRACVESAWAELEPGGSAFQSRRWLAPWFELLAPRVGARPLFVTVRDSSNGRPLIFFAFSVRRRWGLRVAEFPDLGVTDYNAPIWAPDFVPDDEQMKELWATIRESVPRVDLFFFSKIPITLYGRAVPFAKLGWLKPIEMRCWAVKLPASRDEFDATLARKDRKEQRRKRRNLTEKFGEVVVVDAGSCGQAEEFFATLKSMRAERFEQQGRHDILRDEMFASFFRTIVAEGEAFANLGQIRAGDKTIAAFLALRHANDFVLYMHSFAADMEKLSPGIVALDELISHLILSKFDHCDFTIGNEPYKLQFGVKATEMRQGLDPVTIQGKLFGIAFQIYRKLELQLVKIYRKYARPSGSTANSVARSPSGASADA